MPSMFSRAMPIATMSVCFTVASLSSRTRPANCSASANTALRRLGNQERCHGRDHASPLFATCLSSGFGRSDCGKGGGADRVADPGGDGNYLCKARHRSSAERDASGLQ